MRHSRIRRHKKRRARPRTTRRKQRGGQRGLLDSSDAPATIQNTVDFNVRFQPTVKLEQHGPTYTIYQTAHQPYPVWTPPTPPHLYTVISWDPDVPSGKSFLHWMITNCSGSDNESGKIVASWTPPSPPPGTGEHRYIVGLFQQEGPITIPDITDRTNFNATTFATTHKLSPLAYKGFRVNAAEGKPPPPPPAETPPGNVVPLNAPPPNAQPI